MNDAVTGRNAISWFHYWAKAYFPNAFKLTLDELIKALEARPLGKGLLEGLGMGIREAEMSGERVKNAMRSLAQKSGGKIPARNQDFFNYLINEATKVDFVDAIAFTAIETAKDVGTGLQAVGDSAITGLKLINFLLPALMVGGSLFFIWSYSKKSTGEDPIDFFKKVIGK